ncbi:MAG: 4-(cytidine 5'-diphospho)-2-C-methyl-D-erythritol kinase [Ferruginibacter sp.]
MRSKAAESSRDQIELKMVSFPNCKINIGLRVAGKRPDGFHNIESVFYPINFRDSVEIIENDSIKFSHSGLPIPGNTEDNLCIKAYRLLKKDYPTLPDVKIHLHKSIPIGAGLGGGSANASYILLLANNKFELHLSTGQLLSYALQLGSDCPFFIINKPCYATGRGEMLEPWPVDLSAYNILLVNPGIHIDTAWAFSQMNLSGSPTDLRHLISMPIESWQDNIKNDFEMPVFEAHPEIAIIKRKLMETGASYASLSGSGSTVYGIFKKEVSHIIKFQDDYFCKWV